MKTAILTAGLILLAGCSAIPQLGPTEDPIVGALQGQNTDFVQKKLGLPNQRQDLPSGAMVWIYLDKVKGMTANECRVTLSIRNNSVESVVIATEQQSLLSTVVNTCDNIRKAITAA